MAQQTALNTIATPGRTQAFVAKNPAEVVEGGTRRQRQIKSLIQSNRRKKC